VQLSSSSTFPAPTAPPDFTTSPSWDHSALLQHATSYGSAFPTQNDWVMDSGASTHVTGTQGMLSSSHSPLDVNSQHIIVGNGSHLPITATGHAQLTSRPFHLNDVLISPDIVKNLISTRKFARDNSCSVEFDPFGFSVKDLATKAHIMRSNSSGELYPFHGDNGVQTPLALLVTNDVWYRRLGHPSPSALAYLPLDFLSQCIKATHTTPFVTHVN
jgi:hypothetical protein